jgi:hypothetical protein
MWEVLIEGIITEEIAQAVADHFAKDAPPA